MYRLLAIDLDGTLLTPQKTITPRTRHVLSQAVSKGMSLVIASGQTLNVLKAICGDLPLSPTQIIYNGAMIVDIRQNAILQEQLVPTQQIIPTLNLLQNAGLHRVYHTHQHVYVDEGTPNARNWYRPPVAPAIELSDVASLYPEACIKLVGVGNPATLREQRKEFERLLIGQLYVTQASHELLEFLHPMASKGNALITLARMLNIPADQVVAIGDNHNDIGMLHFAGLGIAMGNAHEEVKAVADYVTLRNSEEGVAAAIEEKVLPLL